MGKTAYLEALKRAMTGLPLPAQAKTLAFYEQRFVDGELAGRSEEDVARELDDPKKVAMTLRASIHMQSFNSRKTPANFIRMAVAAVGLLVFNLVMVLPAVVFASVLASLYAVGLFTYLYGVVITSAGISGVNEVDLKSFSRQMHMQYEDDRRTDGNGAVKARISGPNMRFVVINANGREKQIGTAGFMFERELEGASRPVQTFLGAGITIGGILALLLSMLLTRYTLVGIRRYVDMNLSLLKGH